MKFQHFPKRSRKGNTSPFPKSVPEKGTCSHRSPAISSKRKALPGASQKASQKRLIFPKNRFPYVITFGNFCTHPRKTLILCGLQPSAPFPKNTIFKNHYVPMQPCLSSNGQKSLSSIPLPSPPHTTPSLSPLTVTEFGAKTAPNPVFLRFSGRMGERNPNRIPGFPPDFRLGFCFLKRIKIFASNRIIRVTPKQNGYSNSIVPGGLLVRSYITRLTPLTSLIILLITLLSTSYGISAASAVIKSTVFTARSATA